jgi:hypothetical protein
MFLGRLFLCRVEQRTQGNASVGSRFESLTRPVLSCDALHEILHFLSNDDLDGLTKHLLSRAEAGILCLIG